MQVFKKHKEIFLVSLLLLLSFFPRFLGLGSAHFYGDETKTLYIDKTVPATTFFLDQRKGPMQFLVTWVMEKVSGGYDEFWIRLPFAVAGLLGVLIFYLVVKKLFDYKIALVASLLFSFSGFSIAFSRTAQYQSFLILFGLLGLYAALLYKENSKKIYLLASSLFFVLAFYSHYDAIFYFLPTLFLLSTENKKTLTTYFILPLIISVSLFYAPYIIQGYFSSNTVGYLSRRITPDTETLPNNSLYTFLVYNPFVPYAVLVTLLSMVAMMSKKSSDNKFWAVFIWFVVPLITFTLIFKSPGTHILHYYIPLYIFAGVGAFVLRSNILRALFALVCLAQIAYSYYIYIPTFKANYPWKNIEKNYQLFLYGFPYNRDWKQISQILNSQKGAHNFYTNDNTVTAKYYVGKLDVTPPASNFLPEYYVYVYDSQEFRYPTEEFLQNYDALPQRTEHAVIYKLKAIN